VFFLKHFYKAHFLKVHLNGFNSFVFIDFILSSSAGFKNIQFEIHFKYIQYNEVFFCFTCVYFS